ITGTGSLTKIGAGTISMSAVPAANSASGFLTVNGGAVTHAGGNFAAWSGNLLINSGGTFNENAAGTLSVAALTQTTVNVGGAFNTAAAVTMGGNIILNGGSIGGTVSNILTTGNGVSIVSLANNTTATITQSISMG